MLLGTLWLPSQTSAFSRAERRVRHLSDEERAAPKIDSVKLAGRDEGNRTAPARNKTECHVTQANAPRSLARLSQGRGTELKDEQAGNFPNAYHYYPRAGKGVLIYFIDAPFNWALYPELYQDNLLDVLEVQPDDDETRDVVTDADHSLCMLSMITSKTFGAAKDVSIIHVPLFSRGPNALFRGLQFIERDLKTRRKGFAGKAFVYTSRWWEIPRQSSNGQSVEEFMKDMIEEFKRLGVTLVVATGDGKGNQLDWCPFNAGSFTDSVIAIPATDSDGKNATDGFYPPWMTVAGPGQGSYCVGNDNTYDNRFRVNTLAQSHGSSAASAFAVGHLAVHRSMLLEQQGPDPPLSWAPQRAKDDLLKLGYPRVKDNVMVIYNGMDPKDNQCPLA